MTDKKHAIFSTTQVAATISSVIILSNIYFRYVGHSEISLSQEELSTIAALVTPVACNLWIQWKRFKDQKPIYMFKKDK